MKFENRTIVECPTKSVVSIPDICGLFIVDEFLDDKCLLHPLRGAFRGFLFRAANCGVISISLALDTQVRIVWFENEQELSVSDLFEFEPSSLFD